MNQCLFSEVSFRYGPGKHVPGVFFFFFLINPESTVAFTQTSQPFVLVYFRFVGIYVCALKTVIECLYAEKTLSSNNIL